MAKQVATKIVQVLATYRFTKIARICFEVLSSKGTDRYHTCFDGSTERGSCDCPSRTECYHIKQLRPIAESYFAERQFEVEVAKASAFLAFKAQFDIRAEWGTAPIHATFGGYTRNGYERDLDVAAIAQRVEREWAEEQAKQEEVNPPALTVGEAITSAVEAVESVIEEAAVSGDVSYVQAIEKSLDSAYAELAEVKRANLAREARETARAWREYHEMPY